jgi:hypothetical protein
MLLLVVSLCLCEDTWAVSRESESFNWRLVVINVRSVRILRCVFTGVTSRENRGGALDIELSGDDSRILVQHTTLTQCVVWTYFEDCFGGGAFVSAKNIHLCEICGTSCRSDCFGQLVFVRDAPNANIELLTAYLCSWWEKNLEADTGAVTYAGNSGGTISQANFSECYAEYYGSAIYAQPSDWDCEGWVKFSLFHYNLGESVFRSDRPQKAGRHINRFDNCVFLGNPSNVAVCHSSYSMSFHNTYFKGTSRLYFKMEYVEIGGRADFAGRISLDTIWIDQRVLPPDGFGGGRYFDILVDIVERMDVTVVYASCFAALDSCPAMLPCPTTPFSPSKSFTGTKGFSATNALDETENLSGSDPFFPSRPPGAPTPSDRFTDSNTFTVSDTFTPSPVFNQTDNISESDCFMPSSEFTPPPQTVPPPPTFLPPQSDPPQSDPPQSDPPESDPPLETLNPTRTAEGELGKGKKRFDPLMIGIVSGAACAVLVGIVATIVCLRRKSKVEEPSEQSVLETEHPKDAFEHAMTADNPLCETADFPESFFREDDQFDL